MFVKMTKFYYLVRDNYQNLSIFANELAQR